MSKKLLVVFGATGQQGGSVVDQVLQDPALSREFSIRGLTRDPSSPSSQALAKRGVEVVKCDTSSDTDLRAALNGAHTVFSMTTSIYTRTGGKEEEELGNHIADLAVECGAQYLIWSSMVSPKKISGGKYPNVDLFESKYNTEQYIRTLPIKSSFFVPGSFMQNLTGRQKPRPLGDGTYGLFNILNPDAKTAFIDVAADTGKWIAAMLADPDKYAGKSIACAQGLYTQTEIAEILSAATGKSVKHVKIPVEQFASHLPEGSRTMITEMMQYCGEFGYYGATQEEDVRWGAEQARGKLTSLAEYLEREPLKLDE
ncbi:uncharacterized protein PV09_03749 [Verruconis gallopava]|uniref:NmrA-like domain-containing protein n=1 Tax=Verruconis gallopava TaxID=253628 RepID=A0A0D2AFE7_9PEZI|nr:uncharacterized protein PV09_03749 [Verruconis gallopava]KIW05205.1 hypothetical protein PV09_03749 [Verruconis gallopava]